MAARARTGRDYATRIARAMALIAARPGDPPTLEQLADAAAFSPFHFHRIYRRSPARRRSRRPPAPG